MFDNNIPQPNSEGIKPPAPIGPTPPQQSMAIPVSNNPSTPPTPAQSADRIYTMPEKFMPSKRPDATKAGNKKKLFLIIGIIAAVLIILIAIIVYALQVSTVDEEPVADQVDIPTNTNAVVTNNDNTNAANVNGGLNDLTNANTNAGATLNLNVNADLNENINEELFPNANANVSVVAPNANVASVLPDRSRVTDSRDKDRDGLTDVEEALYGTEVNLPDSDKDGFVDGAELKNLFSPSAKEKTLLASGSVIKYENTDFNWSIQYPSQWVAEPLDVTNREVLFTADSVQGEFIQVIVSENTNGVDIAEWFASLYVDIEAADLDPFSAGGLDGIITPDGYTVYVGNKDVIIGIIYSFGSAEKINFNTTYQMMLNSFKYTKKPKQEAATDEITDPTTNAATDTNANAVTNTTGDTNTTPGA